METDFCVELGIYTSAATGDASVVAQVEAICQVPKGTEVKCAEADGSAAPFTPAYSAEGDQFAPGFGGNIISAPVCVEPRTYFTPITTKSDAANNLLIISPDKCVSNVWAVLFAGGSVTIPGRGVDTTHLKAPNLETPHFRVCMSPSRSVSWQRLN